MLLFLSIIKVEAQTSVHYVVSKYNILVGDSAKVTPIVQNARPNSKTLLTISDYINGETFKKNLKPFYFKNDFPGHFNLVIKLKLIENDRVYFEDTQYLDFHTYKLCGDIYTFNDTITTYVGLDYPIKINVQGFSENDIVITAQGVTIRKVGDNFRYVITSRYSGYGQIAITGQRHDGTRVMINKIPIKIKNVPVPTVVANVSTKDSTIELKSILSDQFLIEYPSHVDSFTISYEVSGKKISKKCIGSKIDASTYRELLSLPPKTWIYFENISHWAIYKGGKRTTNIAITMP